MDGLGLATGEFGEARDGVAMGAGETRGLANPQAFAEAFEDFQGLLVGELGVKERGPLEFGEAGLADVAVVEPLVVISVNRADREVAAAVLAMLGALGVLTTK